MTILNKKGGRLLLIAALLAMHLITIQAQHNCRFIGCTGNGEIPFAFINYLLDNLQQLGDARNPNGWGIVYYPENSATCEFFAPMAYRGAEMAAGSSDFDYAQNKAAGGAKVLLAHVRFATACGPEIPNPHPFVKLKKSFAHNGTIDTAVLLSLISAAYLASPGTSPDYRSFLTGAYNDSDLYFIYILQKIGNATELCRVTLAIRRALWDIAGAIGTGAKKMNMVFSDGRVIWAARYASVSQDYYSLNYISGPGNQYHGVSSQDFAGGYSWIALNNYTLIRMIPGQAPAFYNLNANPYLVDCADAVIDVKE